MNKSAPMWDDLSTIRSDFFAISLFLCSFFPFLGLPTTKTINRSPGISSALPPSNITPRHPSNWTFIGSQAGPTNSLGPMILATQTAPLPAKRSVSLPGFPAPHSTRLAPSRGEIFTAPRPGIARRMRQATVVLPHPLPVPATTITFNPPPVAPLVPEKLPMIPEMR